MPTILGICHRKISQTEQISNELFMGSLKERLKSIEDLKQLNDSNLIINFYLEEVKNGHFGSPNQGLDEIIQNV